MFQSLIDQRKLQILSTQRVLTLIYKMSTPEDLEAVLNKSTRNLKKMKDMMNSIGIKILKIIHINREDILKSLK